jgi:hypothetical protein
MASSTNAARRCGKAWKKKPGISVKATTGRTVGGYTPTAAARREAKRTTKAVA